MVYPAQALLLHERAIVAFDLDHVRWARVLARESLGSGTWPDEASEERRVQRVMNGEARQQLQALRAGLGIRDRLPGGRRTRPRGHRDDHEERQQPSAPEKNPPRKHGFIRLRVRKARALPRRPRPCFLATRCAKTMGAATLRR